MSMESATTAILQRYDDNSPVVAANRSWDFFGAPHGADAGEFEPPTIDPSDPVTAIWQRLLIRMVPRSGRPHGIGESAKTQRLGLIVIQTFFPRFTSPQAGLAKLETAAKLFERAHISNVHCGDMNGPEFIELPKWPNFKPVEATIEFIVEDPASTYVQDPYVR